jgi:hypothetical protein
MQWFIELWQIHRRLNEKNQEDAMVKEIHRKRRELVSPLQQRGPDIAHPESILDLDATASTQVQRMLENQPQLRMLDKPRLIVLQLCLLAAC